MYRNITVFITWRLTVVIRVATIHYPLITRYITYNELLKITQGTSYHIGVSMLQPPRHCGYPFRCSDVSIMDIYAYIYMRGFSCNIPDMFTVMIYYISKIIYYNYLTTLIYYGFSQNRNRYQWFYYIYSFSQLHLLLGIQESIFEQVCQRFLFNLTLPCPIWSKLANWH